MLKNKLSNNVYWHILLDNLIIEFTNNTSHSEGVNYDNALKLWATQRHIYQELVDLAEDLIACSASQAHIERVFSICGMLSAGRQNRMNKSMKMLASLKLNNTVLAASGFKFWILVCCAIPCNSGISAQCDLMAIDIPLLILMMFCLYMNLVLNLFWIG